LPLERVATRTAIMAGSPRRHDDVGNGTVGIINSNIVETFASENPVENLQADRRGSVAYS